MTYSTLLSCSRRIARMLVTATLLCMMTMLIGCSGDNAASNASSATSSGSPSASLSQGGNTFTVGFDKNFPPFGFLADDGSYTGFDLELARQVAVANGWEFKAQPIAWDAKDAELKSGAIDCIWNGFTIEGREDAYLFSMPYLTNAQIFMVRADSGITNMNDLAGKTVEVQVDSAAQSALAQSPEPGLRTINTVVVPEYDVALADLEAGATDAVCLDQRVAEYYLTKRPGALKILDMRLSEEHYGVGFSQSNTDLRDKVQAGIDQLQQNGEFAKLSQKYFGTDLSIK